MKHTLKAFVYSCQGLCYAFKNEVAFRYDLVVFILGMIFDKNTCEGYELLTFNLRKGN